MTGLLGVALYDGRTRYPAEIVEVAPAQVRVRWLTDITQSWVSFNHVTTVFDQAPAQLTPGLRVRYIGASGIDTGTVTEVREDFVRIADSPSSRGEWVEHREVVEDLDAEPANRASPTTQAVVPQADRSTDLSRNLRRSSWAMSPR